MPDSSKPSPSAAKHLQVRDAILTAIRAGEYPPASRLPSERDLANRYAVSYMTARRAVTEMVEANLLERRPRSGTYVRGGDPAEADRRLVHLLCPAYEFPVLKEFLRYGNRHALKRGWRVNVVRLHGDDDRQARRIVESGEPVVALLEGPELAGPLGAAMRAHPEHVVLVGNRQDEYGVASILVDDAHAVRLALAHLTEQGHRRVALLSNHPEHPIDRVQVAAWRAVQEADTREHPGETERRLIVVDTPRFECATHYAYEAVGRFLRTEAGARTSAILSLQEEMTVGAMAACRDAGRPVPERMAFVSSGDSTIMALSQPPVTCIDLDLKRHLAMAMDLLERSFEGRRSPATLLNFVQPRLIVRQSVCPPPPRS